MSSRSLQEIDLTGQICADSIGVNIYSGIGGQMDFIRGAALSDGGKVMKESSLGFEVRRRCSHSLPSLVATGIQPIIALPSRTNKGRARIVPTLQEGAGVVTTRYADTGWRRRKSDAWL